MLYVGRNDQQVQLRGYRIELGEIEAVARRTGLIDDIAVLVTRSARGEPQLSAFVTCVEWGPERKARLRTALAELLPSYMVPTRFTHMATLPTAPSGKVDRRALVGE
jgi:acyl-coenzyme A synthetase/AMP-(fatty) acid ligase